MISWKSNHAGWQFPVTRTQIEAVLKFAAEQAGFDVMVTPDQRFAEVEIQETSGGQRRRGPTPQF